MEAKDQIQWLEWDESAFEQARERDLPILLIITASWCGFCRELDRTTFADSDIIREIQNTFVPIRVDKDRRPDINERYNAGGWPTIAFLTPEGELITGETFMSASELLPLLKGIFTFYKENHHELEMKLAEIGSLRARMGTDLKSAPEEPPAPLSPQIIQVVSQSILDQFDPIYGGFGEGQKFPHAESIDYALLYFSRTGDGRMRDVVVYTLDHMIGGEIHDKVEGGFFRYSTTRDWRVPHYEKMLDSNAGSIRFLIEAYQAFGKPEYRQAAEGILKWAFKNLLDPETHGFFGSQDANPEYYSLPLEERRRIGPPKVDRTIYTNWNALMVSSLYRIASALEEESYRQTALQTLNFLIERLYDKESGMYHYWDGTYHIEGLLADQAYTIRALVDTVQHTGQNRYLRLAEDLVEMLERRQAAPEGGYYDILRDPKARGGLQRQNRSILENSVMAEALIRLFHFTGKERYLAAARATLEASSKNYKQYGYYVAGYARALDLFFYGPLVIVIVGERSHQATSALHRAALSRYIPTRIVQCIDPKEEKELLEQRGLPHREKPTAYIFTGKTSYAEISDPRELPSVMEMADRDRIKRD